MAVGTHPMKPEGGLDSRSGDVVAEGLDGGRQGRVDEDLVCQDKHPQALRNYKEAGSVDMGREAGGEALRNSAR